MEFWPILDIFNRLLPYLCSKRTVLGFYKQATHRRPGDEPFLFWGPQFMTGDGPKMVHFGPKLAKHGRLDKFPKWSKWDQNGQPRFFDHLGPFWPQMDKVGIKKIIFFEGRGGGRFPFSISDSVNVSKNRRKKASQGDHLPAALVSSVPSIMAFTMFLFCPISTALSKVGMKIFNSLTKVFYFPRITFPRSACSNL